MKKFTHTLERVEKSGTSGHIRTEGPVEGVFEFDPRVGDGFRFYGKGLTAPTRLIYTSDVAEVTEDGFITQSGSQYILKPL